MPSPYCEIFRGHSRPLEPLPTGEVPMLKRLAGIRAVLFDLYGTLFISASGEVGTGGQAACGAALSGALEAMGIATSGPADQGVGYLLQLIEQSHAESRAAGIDYPEVDIVALWREVLAELARRGIVRQSACHAVDPKRLAVEYEARANPCWPMPHLPECLDRLRLGGLVLGVISNAQFYTPKLFEALLGGPAERWGFQPDLQYYSFRYGCAKPGLGLFERALEGLRARQVAPAEALYVGNDMLNDIFPACKLGLRTALFAGDARSLRRRDDQRQLEAVAPDLVLTDLIQLVDCV